MLLMIIFIALYLWCIMCARMEDTKEESGVGNPRRAVHVDTSRPRKEWGVRCVQRTGTQVGQERDGESEACSARGHQSAKEGVGSKRSVLSGSRRRMREEWGSRLVCVEERKDESGVGVWSKGRKREEWGMYVSGIAINRAEARRKLALARKKEQDGSRHVELLLRINTASGQRSRDRYRVNLWI